MNLQTKDSELRFALDKLKSQTVVCLATGKSLASEDLSLIKDATVIAVNDAYKIYPQADILYGCDAKWWNINKPNFNGLKISLEPVEGIYQMKWRKKLGLDLEFPYLATGENSGYQALNLACYLEPKKIILCGYDMGGTHFFGEHPETLRLRTPFDCFIKNFDSLKLPLANSNIVVYNTAINSNLCCFSKLSLKEALEC